jgi:predicted phage terminase large subunit-like protein
MTSNRDTQALYKALKRDQYERDFKAFFQRAWEEIEPHTPLLWGWAMDAIADHIQALVDGSLGKSRLLINIPPGMSKSVFSSVMLPAWLWTREPGTRIIGASYATSLAMRDAVRSRALIGSEWYQDLWGHKVQIKPGSDSKQYYENTATGWRYASSSSAALTGYRGDVIVVDDGHSAAGAESEAERETTLQWFSETLPSRVNNPNTAKFIVVMQRLHSQDISGFIQEHLSDEYEQLMLPMRFEADRRCETSIGFRDPRTEDGELLFPTRFPENYINSLERQYRAQSGEYAVAGQLQQRPVPRDGGIFKSEHLRYLDADNPVLQQVVKTVRGWDMAASVTRSADYTVGALVGKTSGNSYIILDVVRFKSGPGETEQRLLSTVQDDGYNVLQSVPKDPGAAGKSVTHSRQKLLEGYPCRFTPETGSKELRALPMAAASERGKLYILSGQDWTDAFVSELTTFPGGGRHDDQVDAVTRAFNELSRSTTGNSSIQGGIMFED